MGSGMDWQRFRSWILRIVGTFLCIAAFVNIGGGIMNQTMYGGSIGPAYYLPYLAVFVLGLLILFWDRANRQIHARAAPPGAIR